jgi:DNA repair exonuclease SbcCD nuclease subunit
MTSAIRILHFADLHVRIESHGELDPATGVSTRLCDFPDRIDEVIDYDLSHQTDLAVFAGDAFRRREPDPTQPREFAQRTKHLADDCVGAAGPKLAALEAFEEQRKQNLQARDRGLFEDLREAFPARIEVQKTPEGSLFSLA